MTYELGLLKNSEFIQKLNRLIDLMFADNNTYDGMLFRCLIISLLGIYRNLLKIKDGITFRHTCCDKYGWVRFKKVIFPRITRISRILTISNQWVIFFGFHELTFLNCTHGLFLNDSTDDLTEYSLNSNWKNEASVWDTI